MKYMDSSQRRRARTAERERLKQREQQLKKRRNVFFIAALVVVVVGGALGASLYFMVNSNPAAAAADNLNTDTSTNTATDEQNSSQEALQLMSQFYFFDEDRSQRYVDYYAANPDLTPEQVVIRVDLDLDTTPYEVSSPVTDPDSFQVLVNKHFYLPDDFAPTDLVSVGDISLRYQAALYLQQLMDDAEADGVTLTPASGYRDASYQESLYNGYVDTLGADDANAQSAQPGYSEHETGLAVDFSPTNYQFYDSPQATWLEENAYRYGFIVRYTEENSDITLYIHEPWHIRYVGTEVSTFMHDNNIGSLEEYYVKYIQHTPPAS